MEDNKPTWDQKILDKMQDGAVTFTWDDGEIVTIPAPDGTLENMKSAWTWVDAQLKEFQATKTRPRSLCFRLANGQFRGLRFPDWKPGEEFE